MRPELQSDRTVRTVLSLNTRRCGHGARAGVSLFAGACPCAAEAVARRPAALPRVTLVVFHAGCFAFSSARRCDAPAARVVAAALLEVGHVTPGAIGRRHVAPRCTCVATCCTMLHCAVLRCNVLQLRLARCHVAPHCTMHHVAPRCNVHQVYNAMQHGAQYRNAALHAVTRRGLCGVRRVRWRWGSAPWPGADPHRQPATERKHATAHRVATGCTAATC